FVAGRVHEQRRCRLRAGVVRAARDVVERRSENVVRAEKLRETGPRPETARVRIGGFCSGMGERGRSRRRTTRRSLLLSRHTRRCLSEAAKCEKLGRPEARYRRTHAKKACAPLIRTSWSVSSRVTISVRYGRLRHS